MEGWSSLYWFGSRKVFVAQPSKRFAWIWLREFNKWKNTKKPIKHKKIMNSPIKPICLLIDAPCKALACSDQRCKPWEATSDHMIPGNDALANADLVSKNGVQGWDIAVDIHHKQPVMVVELPMKELNRVVIVTDVNVVKIVSATGCTCFYSVGWSLFHVDFQIFVFSFWILLKSTYSVNIQQMLKFRSRGDQVASSTPAHFVEMSSHCLSRQLSRARNPSNVAVICKLCTWNPTWVLSFTPLLQHFAPQILPAW